MKSYFRKILITVALQICVIAIVLIVYFFNIIGFNELISYIYQKQILQDALSNIRSFLEMCVGIYIAIISILSTGKTSITEKLSQQKRHIPFITGIGIGFIENVFSIVLISFVKHCSEFVTFLIALLVILSIVEIAKFFMVILMMFKDTVSNAANEAKEEKKKYDRIIKVHNDILRYLKKFYNGKSSEENTTEK
ncbi:MAG: hypothetical protein K1W17_03145 [Oscillospiraceae bacterium]